MVFPLCEHFLCLIHCCQAHHVKIQWLCAIAFSHQQCSYLEQTVHCKALEKTFTTT